MRLPILSLCLLPVLSVAAFAEDSVSSPPMGFVKLSLQGRADNLVSVPLLQEAALIGHVLVVGANTLTLDTTGWTPNQFVPTSAAPNQSYYAEISSGALKGVSYRIVSNTIDTLTLDTGSDNLTAHRLGAIVTGSTSAADTVRIRPAWTVGTVFGTSDTSLALSPFATLPTALQVDAGDSLLFFDPAAIGIQKTPSTRLVYVTATGWRTVSDATTDQEGYVLSPLSPILVRLHGAGGQNIVLLGDAYLAPGILRVPGGNGTQANDAFLAVARSEPVSLNNAGLFNSDASKSVVKASPLATQREDLLLAFDPTRKGFERAPEHIYFYLSGETGGWREVGSSSTTIGNDVLLDPTLVYILRKRASSPDRDWLQNPPPP